MHEVNTIKKLRARYYWIWKVNIRSVKLNSKLKSFKGTDVSYLLKLGLFLLTIRASEIFVLYLSSSHPELRIMKPSGLQGHDSNTVSVDKHVNSCLSTNVHQFAQLIFLMSHHCMSRYMSSQGILHAAQKRKFSMKDFFSKCDQIRSFLRIWSHLLKKS